MDRNVHYKLAHSQPNNSKFGPVGDTPWAQPNLWWYLQSIQSSLFQRPRFVSTFTYDRYNRLDADKLMKKLKQYIYIYIYIFFFGQLIGFNSWTKAVPEIHKSSYVDGLYPFIFHNESSTRVLITVFTLQTVVKLIKISLKY